MSIKFKIALLFTFLASLLLAVSGLVIYLFSVKARTDFFDTRLKNRAWTAANIASGINDSNYAVLKKLDTASVASLYNKGITILGTHNEPVYSFADSKEDELHISGEIAEQTRIDNEHFFKYGGRRAVAVHFTSANRNFISAVAAKDKDGEDYLGSLKKIIFWSLAIAIVFSFLTGWFFAGRLVRPVKRIATEINLITSNNLSQRIQTGDAQDELHMLAGTCNLLLDRLQESFIMQRRFISNASHELSTPLTAVSSQIEVALQKTRTAEEYHAVLESVYDDVRGLQQLTKSLLDIAIAGTEGGIELAAVRLDEVLLKVAADVQKLKDSYSVTIDFGRFPDEEQYLTVFGNENLLYIALRNIIENGCKYADDNKATVQALFQKNKIIVSVSSIGDIISEADIQNVFQPFFRTESARRKEGFGLGLTLTKRILALHKAGLEVRSDPQSGTVFTVDMPNNP